MTNDSQMEELRATAAAIAQERALMDKRRDELLSATGKVLGMVVVAVRPALAGAVAPASGLTRTGPGGAGAVEERTFPQLEGVDVRGAHIPGIHTPVEDLPKAQGGKPRGRGLGLLVDGRFVFLSQASTWSKHAEVARSWTATASVLAPSEVGAALKLAHLGVHLSKAPRGPPSPRWGEAPGVGTRQGARCRPGPRRLLQPARVSRLRALSPHAKPVRIVRPVTSGPKRAGHRL